MIQQPQLLPSVVLEILNILQPLGETYLSGGCPRDLFYQKEAHDFDFVTTLPIETLESLFPHFQTTERGREFGVGRFQWKGHQIEITSRPSSNDWLSSYVQHKDFTINSFYHDGTYVYGGSEAFSDIQAKRLHFQEHPDIHLQHNPQSLVRAIRLSGELNLTWSNELLTLYRQNIDVWNSLSAHRLQQEGLRILYAPFAEKAFYYLNELNLFSIPHNNWSPIPQSCKLPVVLCLLSYRTSPQTTEIFLEQFYLEKWKESYEILWNHLKPILPCLTDPPAPFPNYYNSFSFRTHSSSIQHILSFLKQTNLDPNIYTFLRTSFLENLKK